jgi:hypothetical protein
MRYAYRTPIADDYVSAIGRATYNFAVLEWGIVWLGQCLSPNFINEARGNTAGRIGRDFLNAVKALAPSDPARAYLVNLAEEFLALVVTRNELMHGKPHTAADGI